MNFIKNLFSFLFTKNNVITKKIHLTGLVIISTLVISITVIAANGDNSLSNRHKDQDKANLTASEVTAEELEDMQIDEEDETLNSSHAVLIVDQNELEKQNETNDNSKIIISTEQETLVTSSKEKLEYEPNRDAVNLSEDDLNVLYQIVEAEVGSQTFETKIIITNAIINRYYNEYYPDTIKEIVFQVIDGAYQFSPILDGRYWEVTPSKDTKRAVDIAISGYDNSNGALAFVNPSITSKKTMKWFRNSLELVLEHEGIEYYKFN